MIRRQAIIWINADPIHWRIYAAPGWDAFAELGIVINPYAIYLRLWLKFK